MKILRLYIIFSIFYLGTLFYLQNNAEEMIHNTNWEACVLGYNLAVQNFAQTKRLTERVSGDMLKEGQKLCINNLSELK